MEDKRETTVRYTHENETVGKKMRKRDELLYFTHLNINNNLQGENHQGAVNMFQRVKRRSCNMPSVSMTQSPATQQRFNTGNQVKQYLGAKRLIVMAPCILKASTSIHRGSIGTLALERMGEEGMSKEKTWRWDAHGMLHLHSLICMLTYAHTSGH